MFASDDLIITQVHIICSTGTGVATSPGISVTHPSIHPHWQWRLELPIVQMKLVAVVSFRC